MSQHFLKYLYNANRSKCVVEIMEEMKMKITETFCGLFGTRGFLEYTDLGNP